MDPELSERLAKIELLIMQLLRQGQRRKSESIKRTRTVREQAAERARLRGQPTELQIAAARRALARSRMRDVR